MEVGKTNDAQTWLKNVLENAFVDNEEEFWEEKITDFHGFGRREDLRCEGSEDLGEDR